MKQLLISIVIIALFFIFLFVPNNKQLNEEDITPDIIDSPKKEVNIVGDEHLLNEHPCLCLTPGSFPMIDNDSKFYSKSDYYNSYDFTELNLFNELIESSIIFNQYATFMQALETIIIRKKINDYHNPKYYFLKALKNLYLGDVSKSKDYFIHFLNVKNDYFEKNESYFDLGCYKNDIEWIISHENAIDYHISKEILNYLESLGSNNEIDFHSFISSFYEKFDNNKTQYDLIENIIFILLKSKKISIDEILKHLPFNDNTQILYSPLDQLYNDGSDYYLPSQLELISIYKYFQAEKLFKEFKWDFIYDNFNKRPKPYPDWKFSIKHLYSLMHFYEMKINLFDEYDRNIYAHIEKIYNIAKRQPPEIEIWLKAYKNKETYKNSFFYKIDNLFSKNLDILELEKILSESINTDNFNLFEHLYLRNSLINNEIFDLVATDNITLVIPEANESTKDKLDDFLKFYDINRKTLFKSYPSSYDSLNSRIPIYYFKIFDMNDLDKSIHISSKLSENFDIQNEGNDPISSYWNTVRNYLEAKTIMINDYNRCK